LKKALWSLGETVGRVGEYARDPGGHGGATIVSQLRDAHRQLETATLAALAVAHSRGAAPDGIAPLLGHWGEAKRESFRGLWADVQIDAANVDDPGLRKRLQQLWAMPDDED
jgi:hypothetical protein